MDAALTTEEWQIETIDNGPPPGNDSLGISEFRKFRKNLSNSFKLALFCSVRADRIQVAWWQIAVFGLISLLIPLVYDLQSIGRRDCLGRFACCIGAPAHHTFRIHCHSLCTRQR